MDPKDLRDFAYYSQRRLSVEPVRSALFALLREVTANRLSTEGLGAEIDSDILALLAEEVDLKGTLSDLLGGSLFAVQAQRLWPEDRLIWIRDVEEAVAHIAARVPDRAKRVLYSGTGLSSQSCAALDEYVASHVGELSRALTAFSFERPYEILTLAREAMASVSEMEPRFDYPGDVDELLRLWLLGNPVAELISLIPPGIEVEQLAQFIQDYFVYRLPWGLSAFLTMVRAGVGGTVFQTTFEKLDNLPAMVRYGLPSREATWAMSAGISSRRLALRLAERFGRRDASPRVFRQWLADIPTEVLEEYGLSGSDLRQTLRTAASAFPNPLVAEAEDRNAFFPRRLSLRPLARARNVVLGLSTGTPLAVRRDYDNAYDRNAIVVAYGDAPLAYLPRGLAQALAPGMDTGETLGAVVDSVDVVSSAMDIVIDTERLGR
jgi:hypothetical protein